MNTPGNITLVPRRADILEVAAARIIDQATDLPDLGDCTVLLPDLQFAPRLRRQLLGAAQRRGHTALLGPVISTPQQWLHEHIPLDRTVPGRARRELLLVEVLKQHSSVFPGSDPWQLAASLVSLFEELSLHRVHIPEDLAEFTSRLQSAYGLDTHLPEPLGMEAGIVHRLWHAWHVQLDADNLLDPGMACLQRLARHHAAVSEAPLYLAGIDAASGRAECFLYAGTPWFAESGLQARSLTAAMCPLQRGHAASPTVTRVLPSPGTWRSSPPAPRNRRPWPSTCRCDAGCWRDGSRSA